MVHWCWVKLTVPVRSTNWILVGHGTAALAVDADRGCLDIFSCLSFLPSSFSLGDGPISTEILYQRAAKNKTTNGKSTVHIFLSHFLGSFTAQTVFLGYSGSDAQPINVFGKTGRRSKSWWL